MFRGDIVTVPVYDNFAGLGEEFIDTLQLYLTIVRNPHVIQFSECLDNET